VDVSSGNSTLSGAASINSVDAAALKHCDQCVKDAMERQSSVNKDDDKDDKDDKGKGVSLRMSQFCTMKLTSANVPEEQHLEPCKKVAKLYEGKKTAPIVLARQFCTIVSGCPANGFTDSKNTVPARL
jgi:hypothetical protein